MGPVPSSSEARDRSPADAQQLQARTLEDVLAGSPIEPGRALTLLRALAGALEAARTSGLAAASLEPGAVLIRDEGGDDASVELPIGGNGSAQSSQYQSPERILGRDEGRATDVYSLTAVLYHCLTGSVPFPGGRGRAVRFWHLHAPRPRVTALRPDLPHAVDHVIARGMAIDPAARHPNALALIDDAREALGAFADISPTARDYGREAIARRRRRQDERPRRRVSGALVLLAAVGVAVGAGAAGFIVAGSLDDPQSRQSLGRAGPIQLEAPADWRRSRASTSLAGLELADPLSMAPVGSAGTRLIAGIATPDGSVALLTRLDSSPASGDLVLLGQMRARRYRAARLPGSAGPATIYLAPAVAGIATVACVADRARAAGGFMSRCERVAGSLRLSPRAVTPASPSGRQTADLRRLFRRLNSGRARYRLRLARSSTASGQAAAARALARAHVREARALRSLGLTGLAEPGGRACVRALERAAGAYTAAARAAAAGDRGAYASAGRQAAAADAVLRRALRLLRLVGYAL